MLIAGGQIGMLGPRAPRAVAVVKSTEQETSCGRIKKAELAAGAPSRIFQHATPRCARQVVKIVFSEIGRSGRRAQPHARVITNGRARSQSRRMRVVRHARAPPRRSTHAMKTRSAKPWMWIVPTAHGQHGALAHTVVPVAIRCGGVRSLRVLKDMGPNVMQTSKSWQHATLSLAPMHRLSIVSGRSGATGQCAPQHAAWGNFADTVRLSWRRGTVVDLAPMVPWSTWGHAAWRHVQSKRPSANGKLGVHGRIASGLAERSLVVAASRSVAEPHIYLKKVSARAHLTAKLSEVTWSLEGCSRHHSQQQKVHNENWMMSARSARKSRMICSLVRRWRVIRLLL
mmetsp:Transcript_15963/g.55479  ORF Transcript_15963/g.55479 Transcript_15963/m.55479 type:complete len:342 (-) Transcript_15963:3211-4236(-)